MDYYQIGQRIRKYRKAKGLSQEQLAERAGISVPHMSHIETGNTKLSLPVLVELAVILEVHTDELIFDEPPNGGRLRGEFQALLDSCDARQVQVLLELSRAAKLALDKHY